MSHQPPAGRHTLSCVPTYSYACRECEHRFDIQQAFSDNSLTTCPECGGKLRKVYSSVGVVFKGSGFYSNDSRTGSAARSSASNGSNSSESDSSSKTSDSSSSGAGDSGSGSKDATPSGGDKAASKSAEKSAASRKSGSPEKSSA